MAQMTTPEKVRTNPTFFKKPLVLFIHKETCRTLKLQVFCQNKSELKIMPVRVKADDTYFKNGTGGRAVSHTGIPVTDLYCRYSNGYF
jgi:hypothetical protein